MGLGLWNEQFVGLRKANACEWVVPFKHKREAIQRPKGIVDYFVA